MNWQTAFLLAFHSHFARLLDVEKWWGLICVSFSESDLTQPWTEQECWHKLQEALDVPVEVHFAPSRMPAKARVTLQEVIHAMGRLPMPCRPCSGRCANWRVCNGSRSGAT